MNLPRVDSNQEWVIEVEKKKSPNATGRQNKDKSKVMRDHRHAANLK